MLLLTGLVKFLPKSFRVPIPPFVGETSLLCSSKLAPLKKNEVITVSKTLRAQKLSLFFINLNILE